MATKKQTDITTLRDQIAATQAELAAVARAPLPVAEAEAAMGTLLDRAAAQYDPAVTLFAHDPDPQLDALSLLLPDARWNPQGMFAFMAATVDRAVLVALWRERLRAAYETDPTLAAPIALAERAPRLEVLRQRLHALELQEETLIVEAEHSGLLVDRREDARPEILFAPDVLAEAAGA